MANATPGAAVNAAIIMARAIITSAAISACCLVMVATPSVVLCLGTLVTVVASGVVAQGAGVTVGVESRWRQLVCFVRLRVALRCAKVSINRDVCCAV